MYNSALFGCTLHLNVNPTNESLPQGLCSKRLHVTSHSIGLVSTTLFASERHIANPTYHLQATDDYKNGREGNNITPR